MWDSVRRPDKQHRERLYGHINDIRTANNIQLVSKYFSTNNHDVNDVDITVWISTPRNTNICLTMEEAIISKFKSRTPYGLNLKQCIWNKNLK